MKVTTAVWYMSCPDVRHIHCPVARRRCLDSMKLTRASLVVDMSILDMRAVVAMVQWKSSKGGDEPVGGGGRGALGACKSVYGHECGGTVSHDRETADATDEPG